MRSAVVDLGSQPVWNRCSNPSFAVSTFCWVGQPGGGAVTIARVAGPPFNYGRVTWTADSTNSNGAGILYNGTALPDHVVPGVPFQTFMRVRCSFAQSVRISIGWRSSLGATVGSQSISGSTTLTAGAWSDLSFVAAPPAGATRAVITLGGGIGSTTWTTGSTLDLSRLMIGNPGQEFADGNTPGWRWLGTDGVSESVGYPYTLGSIAGAPVFDQNGSTPLTLVALPPAAAADSGFSAYHAFELVGDNFAGDPMLRYGKLLPTTNDNDGVYLNRVDTGEGVGGRRTHLGRLGAKGTNNFVGTNIPLPTSGRHISSMVVNDGWTSFRSRVDDSAISSGALSASIVGGSMGVTRWASGYGDVPVRKIMRQLVFNQSHDAQTQERVMAWLARQYDAPVPVGF